MSNRRGPITLGGKAFRDSAMLVGAELTDIEKLVVAAAMSADGAPDDADGDHYRDNQQDEQHAEGEPAARYRRAFLDEPEEQVMDPLEQPLGQRALGVERLFEFAVGGFGRGIAGGGDGGHARVRPHTG